MGREIKRVAANFKWPIEKIWSGFVNPHYEGHCSDCPSCDGSGYSMVARRLYDEWFGRIAFVPSMTGSTGFSESNVLVRHFAERNVSESPSYYRIGEQSVEQAVAKESKRLADLFNGEWMHHLDENDVAELVKADRLMDLLKHLGRTPTAQEVNRWSISAGIFGHDSINAHICIEAKCERLGVEVHCATCDGEGTVWDSPKNKERAERWERAEPPAGDWWQVWETVSEGSPVTPAFPTAEALIEHLVTNGDAWDRHRGDGGWSREAAVRFVTAGWAPSLMGQGTKLYAPRDGFPV